MSAASPRSPDMQSSDLKHVSLVTFLAVCAIAIGLTWIFWPTLWAGGGLVGGDIYPYFYPQKQFYAEALRAGEIPLWNNRTGNGYPTVGESQTGVFYPVHALYAVLELNTAYNAIQLGHYVLAFVWCWLLARRWGLGTLPACLAAVVYTYGWLPTRICVEWAAIGAAWFPAALWCGESFLQTAKRRYLVILSLVLGVQMLAGHFHLAFITQVTLAAYVGLRLFVVPGQLFVSIETQRFRALLCICAVMLCGFGLAAIQLGPTWELKQLSQRAALGDEHDPGYGYIPWWYLGQLIAPWSYYVPGLNLGPTPAGASRTNTVEAHLYCGLVPLFLVGLGLLWRRQQSDRGNVVWWILGASSIVYATGVLMPVAKYLPGFGFFNGVGRYGIVFNLAIGLLAAEAFQRLAGTRRSWGVMSVGTIVLVLATSDVWMISRMVQHSFAVARPPLKYLNASPIREELARSPVPVRLFCRGANLPNLLGVSSTPVYLGIGPQAYFDPTWKMPEPLPYEANPTPEQIAWLRRAGVTHILSFTPLDLAAWPVTMLMATPDPFLNRAWARGGNDPFYLYELADSRGRVAWAKPLAAAAQITSYRANSVTITTDSPADGTLILTDLSWPGWRVQIDGRAASPVAIDQSIGPYRAVSVPAGQHTVIWNFRPNSVWIGALVSAATVVLLVVAASIKPALKREEYTGEGFSHIGPLEG